MPHAILHYSEEEVLEIVKTHVQRTLAVARGNIVAARAEVSGGLSGNDPRERRTPYLSQVVIEIDREPKSRPSTVDGY